MGLFSNKSNDLPSQWILLNSEQQLEDIIKASNQKPQVIFKDSTSCGISAGVKSGLVGDWNAIADQADFHYLDLLNYRSISSKIAQVSGVTHQSPQVIIYHHGKVIANTSHFAINVKFIKEALAA